MNRNDSAENQLFQKSDKLRLKGDLHEILAILSNYDKS
jgi:hypothetical protein